MTTHDHTDISHTNIINRHSDTLLHGAYRGYKREDGSQMTFRDIDPHDIPGYAPKPKLSRRKKLWEAVKMGLIGIGFLVAVLIGILLIAIIPTFTLWYFAGWSEETLVFGVLVWILILSGITVGIEHYRELK